MTRTLLLVFAAAAAQAQTLSTATEFNANNAGPTFLMQGSDGNFYGITGSESTTFVPIIFKMTSDNTVTTLFSEAEFNPASLIQGADGNLYGAAPFTDNGGLVFKMTPSGNVSIVFNFGGAKGANPGGLIQASDGNFYGITSQGGITETSQFGGDGTVFKLTPSGVFTKLHDFVGTDGTNPGGGLVQGADGNLYGTTSYGGASDCALTQVIFNGCGTVFKITPQGSFTTLVNFSGSNGSLPSGLTLGSDGNFYGVTGYGGSGTCPSQVYKGCGTVYKITPAGSLTTLHSFEITDGAQPSRGLIQASDGNFYGTTSVGGAGPCHDPPIPNGCGSIFKITPAGALSTVYSFPAASYGNNAFGPGAGPIIQAANANFYGTEQVGGASGNGIVYELSLGLTPQNVPAIAASSGILDGASFQPGISANSWITINGTNLSSKTDTWNNSIVSGALPTSLDGVSVMIGGQPAYIEYVSPTQINAIAPSVNVGPQPVTVTTANGTSPSVLVEFSAMQPAFFQWGNYAVATRQDFSLAVKNGTFTGATTVPAKPGDVIILWGTGFGPTSPSAPAGAQTPSTATYNTATPVTVKIGTQSATVYGAALAPGYAGLYQVAIQIPASLANGDYPVVATIAGVQSPSTTMITIQQ
jgi:uncharacterized protein (TIGR03437 family)